MARHFVSKQEKKYDMNSNPLDAVPEPDHKGTDNNKNMKNTNSPQRTENVTTEYIDCQFDSLQGK